MSKGHFERYRLKDYRGNYCSATRSGELICNSSEVDSGERFDFHLYGDAFGSEKFGIVNLHGKYCKPADIPDIFEVAYNSDNMNVTDVISHEIKMHNDQVEAYEKTDVNVKGFENSTDSTCSKVRPSVFPSRVDDYQDKNRLVCHDQQNDFRFELKDNLDGTISFKDRFKEKWCAPNKQGNIVCDDNEIENQNIFETWNEIPHVEMHPGSTIARYIGLTTSECVKRCASERACAGISMKLPQDECKAGGVPCDIPESRCVLKSNIFLNERQNTNYSYVDLQKKTVDVAEPQKGCESGSWQHSKYTRM